MSVVHTEQLASGHSQLRMTGTWLLKSVHENVSCMIPHPVCAQALTTAGTCLMTVFCITYCHPTAFSQLGSSRTFVQKHNMNSCETNYASVTAVHSTAEYSSGCLPDRLLPIKPPNTHCVKRLLGANLARAPQQGPKTHHQPPATAWQWNQQLPQPAAHEPATTSSRHPGPHTHTLRDDQLFYRVSHVPLAQRSPNYSETIAPHTRAPLRRVL